jgi:thiamine-phosphate diphosphorylase
MSGLGGDRREQLDEARLYLICDSRAGKTRLEELLAEAVRGGVDVVQLRDKNLGDRELVSVAGRMRAACAELGVLFIVNDNPSAALQARADGVHVGQGDMPVAEARELVGTEMLIGLSTHTRAQIRAAASVGRSGPQAPDYISVGPVFETPTKPGRAAVGVALVRYAAANTAIPFFAIGGISPENVRRVGAAGAPRVAVVRAIADATRPQHAARSLREGLDSNSLELAYRATTAL